MPSRPAPLRRARFSTTAIVAIVAVLTLAIGGGVWALVAAQSSKADTVASATTANSGPVSSGVLHADTRMGAVALSTAQLPALRSFYADAVGLDVLSETETEISLGFGEDELIHLVHDSVASARGMSDAGLYHSAILLPDAASLASTLLSVAEQAPSSYQGSADHRVSLAFYFGDPDGNGVELYVDRPREEWHWVDGRVTMGSDALDPNQFIAENLSDDAPAPATMGHVHLSVGNLDDARTFYVDVLGFDITSESTGALFMSAGGYHHHLAANTWNSINAGPRGVTLGLREFTVVLANSGELDAASARLAAARVPSTLDGGVLRANDPWGNTVVMRATAS